MKKLYLDSKFCVNDWQLLSATYTTVSLKNTNFGLPSDCIASSGVQDSWLLKQKSFFLQLEATDRAMYPCCKNIWHLASAIDWPCGPCVHSNAYHFYVHPRVNLNHSWILMCMYHLTCECVGRWRLKFVSNTMFFVDMNYHKMPDLSIILNLESPLYH